MPPPGVTDRGNKMPRSSLIVWAEHLVLEHSDVHEPLAHISWGAGGRLIWYCGTSATGKPPGTPRPAGACILGVPTGGWRLTHRKGARTILLFGDAAAAEHFAEVREQVRFEASSPGELHRRLVQWVHDCGRRMKARGWNLPEGAATLPGPVVPLRGFDAPAVIEYLGALLPCSGGPVLTEYDGHRALVRLPSGESRTIKGKRALVFVRLVERGTATLHQLCGDVQMSEQTVAGILRDLEKRGFVRRPGGPGRGGYSTPVVDGR